MTLITVPCGVCGGAAFEPLYSGTIPADNSDPPDYFSSSRVKAGYLPVVCCVQCGLVMTNPRDDDATLKRVYAVLEDNVYAAEDDNRRRTAEEHLALVTKHQQRPARLLDVGCATGAFVSVAQVAGWQTTGLEASAWAVARARKRCPQASFTVGLLEEADFPAASFEVITLWDVLEHVRSPQETLQRVHGWLAPGGWLFLNLPNADSLVARLMGRHWVLLLREHLWYFSPTTIGLLLHQNGFELISTRPNFVRFSATNIFGRLGQYPGVVGRFGRHMMRWRELKNLSLKFPIGEMNVVAKS